MIGKREISFFPYFFANYNFTLSYLLTDSKEMLIINFRKIPENDFEKPFAGKRISQK